MDSIKALSVLNTHPPLPKEFINPGVSVDIIGSQGDILLNIKRAAFAFGSRYVPKKDYAKSTLEPEQPITERSAAEDFKNETLQLGSCANQIEDRSVTGQSCVNKVFDGSIKSMATLEQTTNKLVANDQCTNSLSVQNHVFDELSSKHFADNDCKVEEPSTRVSELGKIERDMQL